MTSPAYYAKGDRGYSIHADSGPPGLMAPDWDLYVDTATGDTYRRQSGVWNLVGNLRGPKGDQGDRSTVPGPPNSLSIGTVISGDAPDVTITGESPSQSLNFILPKGDKGDKGGDGTKGDKGDSGPPNVLAIGEVRSGAAPHVEVTGTSPAQTLHFTLPKGEKGDKGPPGDVSQEQLDARLAALVASAPEALDTLSELANALNNDPEFATTIMSMLGGKADDDSVVHREGAEDIYGDKTFSDGLTHRQKWTMLHLVNALSDQYSGAGFKVYSDAPTMTGAAGAQFSAYISDPGATSAGLEIATIDRTGEFLAALFQFSLDTHEMRLTGDLSMGGNRVKEVADGVEPGDAVNRGQVEGALGNRPPFHVGPTPPGDTSMLWIDTSI